MSSSEKINGYALLPLLVFVGFFLASGIYLGNFYLLKVPIALLLGIVTAFLLFRHNSVRKNLDHFITGCSNPNILIMCMIALFSGAFAMVTSSIGATNTFVQITENYLSLQYLYAGVFLIASFLSFASGTSVGAITTLAPIVAGFVRIEGVQTELIAGSLLGGAMFGDNLSFISDTTIAATQSQGCEMKDKFRVNVKIAFPAMLLSVIILVFTGISLHQPEAINAGEVSSISWITILPYIFVIVLATIGVNVFVTFLLGTIIAGGIGIFQQKLGWLSFATKIYDGFAEMNEIFLVFLFTGGLAYMIEKEGGIAFLTKKIMQFVNTQGKAKFGIGFLVGIVDAAIANNTVAIVITAPVAKKISQQFDIDAKQTASILDIISCVVQGIIPYGAQILFLIKLLDVEVNYLSMVSQSYYIWLLLLFAIIYFSFFSKKAKLISLT
ncbi:MAG: Na+/H+ antiporter NhaC family protein [Capnocytophaga sp.]|nr:Na+/H+ antiporter NhaC family protein [Capnocytophaga sp.]